ncbi:hypothetical protein OG785_32220 [Streptomyces sp. NBC_00006]|uniref:hypothetical protein n=1 Tax=Streptomyces sp. NBC_00006 TaxID=2975619 RepID=UPI00224F4BFB|nr:hypothetical protein [Streptomyces sp. NBC_00006]MCX5535206.1 hypothetical protein [Streptomyces sp. NBC_00006]
MPTSPTVTITREDDGNVIAKGGDALANALLTRAGFIYEQSIRTFWYRLHWDTGKQRENQRASHAARMLTAVGYRVEISPDLVVGAVTTPSDPQSNRVYGHQLLTLTDQLNGANSSAAAAGITEHVLDPHDGVLVRLGEFFEAAAEKAKETGTDEGWDLSDDFTEAAATLTSLGEDLHVATDRLRALDRPPRPSWQDQVVNYYASAPATHHPDTAAPSAAPAAAPPSAPKPGRTR